MRRDLRKHFSGEPLEKTQAARLEKKLKRRDITKDISGAT